MSNIKRKLKKYQAPAIAALCLIFTAIICLKGMAFLSDHNPFETPPPDESTIKEGPLTKVVVEAGPFDLHRHYLSMEGPWTSANFKAGELIASKNVNLPEGMVEYLEAGGGAASMAGAGKPEQYPRGAKPEGVVTPAKGPRQLYWFKGVKLEVLDENGKVLPDAEFICHWNLDVNPAFRNRIFRHNHECQNPRLSSVSQGETLQILPPGFGVPIASDEPLDIVFQAANRTSDVRRRVKHRCTLYFVKDKELVFPIKALYCYTPYTTVVVDKNVPELSNMQKRFCPVCVGTSEGVDAPNDRAGGTFPDKQGRRLSGHWVIPPGQHTYRDVIGKERDDGFAQGNPIIRAAWTHVHPLCTKLSLVENVRDKRRVVLSTDCRTKITPGLQIMYLGWLTPKGGVKLNQEANYELEVTYNNVLKTPVDSMASMGVYMQDDAFYRPKWALHDFRPEDEAVEKAAEQDPHTLMSCAIPKIANQESSSDSTQLAENPADINRKVLPLFDAKKDGPYLTKAQNIEMTTSCGPLNITLDPKLAPKTCTHLCALMKNGCFAGTPFFDCTKDFLVLAQASNKSPGQKFLNQSQVASLRRLPLEVDAEGSGHNQLSLSLCRDENDPNSAVSSFCIVLDQAHHLDGHYTVFGHVNTDARTLATLKAIEERWNGNPVRPYIISCKIK